MVSRNNAVFRFILDIKDFLTKGRQVSQVLNKISGDSQKASVDVEKLSGSFDKTGKSATAAAVNFQTATQGMLNLTTAGVQTFTSFSNLDRAANRLAQAQVGLARAEDLLNNKQLRLNELRAKGLGHSAKAIQLEKELGTARADLIVKTDKLRIEEGALLDIQLLFATNVANVMISSLQTIKTLKDLNVASTIKATAVQKLQNLGIIEAATVQHTYKQAVNQTTIATQAQVNMNRLLTLSIPVVGVALAGLTVGVQAYNENWGGFKDGLQAVFPLLKDHKELLKQTKEEMALANGVFDEYNGSLSDNQKELDLLPMRYDLLINRIKKLREEASLTGTTVNKVNQEIGKIPADFRSPSTGGQITATGGVVQGIPTGFNINSNVVRTEGDASFTAKAIKSSSVAIPTTNDFIKLASAGILAPYNPSMINIPKNTIKSSSTLGGNVNLYDFYSLYNFFAAGDPTTSAYENLQSNIMGGTNLAKGAVMAAGQVLTPTAKFLNENPIAKTIITSAFGASGIGSQLLPKIPTDFEELTSTLGSMFRAGATMLPYLAKSPLDPKEGLLREYRMLGEFNRIKYNLAKGNIPVGSLSHLFGPKPSRLLFASAIRKGGGNQILGELGREHILRAGTPEEQLEFLLREGASMGFNIETEEDAFRYLLAIEEETDFLKGFTAVYSNENIPTDGELIETLSQEKFFEKTATERAERFKKAELFKIQQKQKLLTESKLIAEAAKLGISTDDLIFRRGIGGSAIRPGLGTDILRFGLQPTEQQMKFLESTGKLMRFQFGNGSLFERGPGAPAGTAPEDVQYAYEFVPKKVKEAWAIREQQLAGNNLSDNTPHDRLVKAAFNGRNLFGPTQRSKGFTFGSAGGTLNMAYSGLILSKDDPLLKGTSNMGEMQSRVFMETGMDIGGVAENLPYKEALRIANLDKQMATFANTTGGSSNAAISYLNMVGKTNAFGQSVTMNNLLSSKHSFANVAAGRVMGRTDFFGTGFFKSSGATAAYQVPRGSIKVDPIFEQMRANRDAFANGAGTVYMQAVRSFLGRATGPITLSKSAARAQQNLNLDKTYMNLASTFGMFDDPEFLERLNQMQTNINAGESSALNTATHLFNEAHGISKEFLQINQKILKDVGIDVNILQTRTFSHWKGFAGGKRHAIYDYYTPAEMTADMLKEIGAVGMGLGIQMDTAFLQNMAMLGKFNSTNFNNTSILDNSISRLNISRRQALQIRLDYKRGDNELRDRLRWRQRLDGMSTGNVVL